MDGGETLASEARSEFHLTDCEATFKVTNFVAAVTATDTTSMGRDNYRELSSGPIMSAGDFKFAIVIIWGVDSHGNPDRQQKMGFCVKRIDNIAEVCTLNMTRTLVNQTDSKSWTVRDDGFFRVQDAWGTFPWKASKSGYILSDIFDPSKGWLHDGALHVRAKLVVVTNIAGTSISIPDSHSSQQAVCDSMASLLESKLYSDVSIKVGNTTIEAHRNILAARSPVFEAMLSSEMKEGQERKVIIRDLDPGAVQDLITYLYTGAVRQETMDNDDLCLPLLQAAHRYKADGLINKCAEIIGRRLDLATVCDRLEFGDMLGCDNLKNRCLGFICQHIAEIQHTETYAKLCRRPSLLMDIIAAVNPPAKRRRMTDPEP